MIFEDVFISLKKHKIWDVICLDKISLEPKENICLYFSLGEPYLKLYMRKKHDYCLKCFRKHLIPEEKYSEAVVKSDFSMQIIGYWKLLSNNKELLDSKNKENREMDYYKDLLNFLFQGHKIKKINLSDEITITFSNKMTLSISKEDNIDGFLLLTDARNTFGLSIEEGNIGKKRIQEKISQFF